MYRPLTNLIGVAEFVFIDRLETLETDILAVFSVNSKY